jgi:hypothetical protein
MSDYAIQFFTDAARAAPLATVELPSRAQSGAMREARQLWEIQAPERGAKGYRVVHVASGTVVYDYQAPA